MLMTLDPTITTEVLTACSANFCDNLLVETDILCHFWDLILCNKKCLQFYQNKKQEHRGKVHQVFYYPMSSLFLIYGVVSSVCVFQFFFFVATDPL